MTELDALAHALESSPLGQDRFVQNALAQLRNRISVLESHASGKPIYQMTYHPLLSPLGGFNYHEVFPDRVVIGVNYSHDAVKAGSHSSHHRTEHYFDVTAVISDEKLFGRTLEVEFSGKGGKFVIEKEINRYDGEPNVWFPRMELAKLEKISSDRLVTLTARVK